MAQQNLISFELTEEEVAAVKQHIKALQDILIPAAVFICGG